MLSLEVLLQLVDKEELVSSSARPCWSVWTNDLMCGSQQLCVALSLHSLFNWCLEYYFCIQLYHNCMVLYSGVALWFELCGWPIGERRCSCMFGFLISFYRNLTIDCCKYPLILSRALHYLTYVLNVMGWMTFLHRPSDFQNVFFVYVYAYVCRCECVWLHTNACV